jgi:hypothetical protein
MAQNFRFLPEQLIGYLTFLYIFFENKFSDFFKFFFDFWKKKDFGLIQIQFSFSSFYFLCQMGEVL